MYSCQGPKASVRDFLDMSVSASYMPVFGPGAPTVPLTKMMWAGVRNGVPRGQLDPQAFPWGFSSDTVSPLIQCQKTYHPLDTTAYEFPPVPRVVALRRPGQNLMVVDSNHYPPQFPVHSLTC
jgi:hypothetical protein